MKKILKGVSILLIILVLIISLVGCSNGIEGESMTFQTFEKALNLYQYDNISIKTNENNEISYCDIYGDKIRFYTSIDSQDFRYSNKSNIDVKYFTLIEDIDNKTVYDNLIYNKDTKNYVCSLHINNYQVNYKIEINRKKLTKLEYERTYDVDQTNTYLYFEYYYGVVEPF